MKSIETSDSKLVYATFGTGKKFILCFHGFGQDKFIYEKWVAFWGDKYTFYSFDLFYYGDSYRPYRPLSKQEWKNFVDKFLKQEPQIDEFSIIGYSLGGRFAIATALAFKEKVEQLFLIAPDGIFLSVWYKMATTPGLQLIFKYYILHPDKLEKLIKFNERLRIITKYIADFARKEMGSPENRKRVYLSWNYFKTLGYSKRSLYRKFQHASFERTLYLGSKDYVIIPNKILPFIQKMSKFEVKIIDAKHHQLIKPEILEL